MKALRRSRKIYIDRARKKIKKINKQFGAIKGQIKTEGKTIPEIAAALRMETAEVLLLVSAMRKYGIVAEGPKDGDYFKYELAES